MIQQQVTCYRYVFCIIYIAYSICMKCLLDYVWSNYFNLLQAWARLCKCLGQDFLPYMEFVMPPLLKSASLKPDVTITSADSDNDIEDSDDERSQF